MSQAIQGKKGQRERECFAFLGCAEMPEIEFENESLDVILV